MKPLILITALLALAGCETDVDVIPSAGGIAVSGTGELRATPDMATVTFEVTREGRDAAALKSELDAVVRAVLELTDRLDIARDDVTAAAVNLYPRYRREDDDRVLDGVTARRSIDVTLRDLDDYGTLVNDAIGTGINGVSGIRLDVADRGALERQALDAAIADAQEQAARVAKGFDVDLGELLSVDVDSSQPAPYPVARMAMESAGGDFSAGQIDIRRSVRATFAIDDD